MRLFLAIELPQRVQEHLSRVQGALRQRGAAMSWTRETNLHLTLKFLGEVPQPQVAPICDALQRVERIGSLELHAQGLVLLPPHGAVRVVGAQIGGGTDLLGRLQQRVESCCRAMGFSVEGRRYLPHVTLARAKARTPPPSRVTMQTAATELWPGPSFAVEQFALIESQLHPAGARYFPLAHFELKIS